ncbi:MAG: cupin domain-containing protein [Bryobacteraceae bacterium]|nr:cupin domain-containing protein [Bryobacteraceae bacterium]
MNRIIEPYVLTNGNCPAFWLIDNLWMPLATSFLTDNRFTLIEQVCATGIGGPPTHTHPTDEGFYVLEGQCTFQAGGRTVVAGPGTFISVPRNIEHSFTVDQAGTRVLNFYTPAGFEMILMSIAMPAQERVPPPPNAVPLPPRWIVEELSREYGQTAVLGLPFVDIPNAENTVTRPLEGSTVQPYGLRAGEAPTFWWDSILWSLLASGEQTGGSYSLIEEICPRDSGPPAHTHEQDEALYLIDGALTVMAGSKRFEMNSGSFAYIPAGTVHSFRADSAQTRLLNFYFPAGFERTIQQFAEPALTRTRPLEAKHSPDIPEPLKALYERIGTRLVAVPDFLRERTDEVSTLT